MIRTLFLLITALLLRLQLEAQHKNCGRQIYSPKTTELDFHPCGTANYTSDWHRAYRKNPARFQKNINSRSTTYVPITLHLVGKSDSTGFGKLSAVLNSFCQLNKDYKQTGLQFYINFPIRYIANSTFLEHDSTVTGGRFMLQYNEPTTLNVYFVRDPRSTCGYNLPYAGVAMNYSCLNGHTFAHELGHNLSVQHTFLGWEGGQSYNGISQTTFSGPAPKTVFYDYTNFKDTMWTDTLIIDATEVEYVTRTGAKANCATAADGFCDTPADYLSYRWPCNNNNMSLVTQYDPDTVAFQSNGANFMSYASDNCSNTFSSEQALAMKSYLNSKFPHILSNQNPNRDSIGITPSILNPNSTPPANAVSFKWNTVPGATHYLITIKDATPSILEEVLVTDTSYTSSLYLQPYGISFFRYSVEIKAINQGYTCAPTTGALAFNTALPSNTQRLLDIEQFSFYPNPIHINQGLILKVNSKKTQQLNADIIAVSGQLLQTTVLDLQAGMNQLNLSTGDLSPGVYFVKLKQGNRSMTQKLIVQP